MLVQCQNPEIEARQKKSAIAVPAEVVTDLREDVMTPLLKKKSIAKVPLGSVMYLNHPNWKLTGLGSLLLLKPACLKELDLRDNDLFAADAQALSVALTSNSSMVVLELGLDADTLAAAAEAVTAIGQVLSRNRDRAGAQPDRE